MSLNVRWVIAFATAFALGGAAVFGVCGRHADPDACFLGCQGCPAVAPELSVPPRDPSTIPVGDHEQDPLFQTIKKAADLPSGSLVAADPITPVKIPVPNEPAPMPQLSEGPYLPPVPDTGAAPRVQMPVETTEPPIAPIQKVSFEEPRPVSIPEVKPPPIPDPKPVAIPDPGPTKADPGSPPPINPDPSVPLPGIVPSGLAPPPAPAPKAAPFSCPWTFNMKVTDGRTRLEAKFKDDTAFTIECDKFDMHTPDGKAVATGGVKLSAKGVEGSCNQLTIVWTSDRLTLEGDVTLKCLQGGQDVELKSSSATLGLRKKQAAEPQTYSFIIGFFN
jgi:hypothetical protein